MISGTVITIAGWCQGKFRIVYAAAPYHHSQLILVIYFHENT